MDFVTKMETFVTNPRISKESCVAAPVQNGNNNFFLDVNTYILILELFHLDMEKRTFSVWVELGFCYDVHDFFRTFDNFVSSDEKGNDREKRLKTVCAEDLQIPFDVVNALSMEQRSEAHFIRRSNGYPGRFYGEDENFNKELKASYLSDAKNLVNTVDISSCPRGQYWKHETRTFQMELSFQSTERLAPFDQIHLFFKLITANCQPGTNRIKFIYNEKESDFSGMKHAISGFHPFTDKNKDVVVTVNKEVDDAYSYSNSDVSWDRLYISVAFRKQGFEQMLTYYFVPFLLFNYMVIKDIKQDTEALLGTSSTLVLANVALLIVSSNNIFTFYEQAVLIQITVLISATLIMAYFEEVDNLQVLLASANFAVFCMTLGTHYVLAKRENTKVMGFIKKYQYGKLNMV